MGQSEPKLSSRVHVDSESTVTRNIRRVGDQQGADGIQGISGSVTAPVADDVEQGMGGIDDAGDVHLSVPRDADRCGRGSVLEEGNALVGAAGKAAKAKTILAVPFSLS